MGTRIVQVDAFTSVRYAGNPAAICILDEPAAEHWMQAVAREMNLSETAFVHPDAEGFRLRWFTPRVEVDLCGHATLASAHVLWEEGHLSRDRHARFHTRSGLLTAESAGDWIRLDFPAQPPSAVDLPGALPRALGIDPLWGGRSPSDFLLELDSEAAVRAVDPDFGALSRVETRGVIVTAPAEGAGLDFVSRFFAPAVGVDEDPVTGSAHCCLGPFWSERLGRRELVGRQVSERGGEVRVRVAGDRVTLAGQAVTVLRGELL